MTPPVVGTLWREREARFARIVRIVESDQHFVRLRTHSIDGTVWKGGRVTRSRTHLFLRRFRPVEGDRG